MSLFYYFSHKKDIAEFICKTHIFNIKLFQACKTDVSSFSVFTHANH